jgi:hypothetical protein
MADQTFSLMENAAAGTVAGKLIASDPDAGQVLSYSILSGNTGNTFNLNAVTGVLSVANPSLLVYATNPVFTLQVTVQDNGPGALTTTSTATINLIQNTDHFVYIDPGQANNPLENGSILHPYNSWADVIFNDGYSYFQKRGTTYTGITNINVYSKNNITIDAYGTGTIPVIENVISNAKVIDLSSSRNCTIRNIEIRSAGAALCCVYLSGNLSSGIVIDNCFLHDAQYGVRSILRGNGLRILNSTISRTGFDGIYAANFQNIEIGNCTISDVNQKWFQNPNASESTGDCIELNSANGYVNINHNVLNHSSTGNMAVISISGTSYSGTIEYNTMTGNRLSNNECLRLNSSNKTITVRYNTISEGLYAVNDNIASCIIYYNQFISNTEAIRIQKSRTADIKNNTFSGNTTYAIESLSGTSVSSRNNIFYLDALSTKVYKFGGTVTSNYNNFNTEKTGFLNGYSTLSNWSNATNQDRNSVLADPQFINISTKDFRLQTGSPCINRGTDLGLVRDFFGTTVPQEGVPDIGFYEMVSAVKVVTSGNNNLYEEPEPYANDVLMIGASIYPNPTAGIVHIKLENVITSGALIKILDMQGKTIATASCNADTEITIDLGDQKPGMYIAAISSNNNLITRKIIVQN